MNNNKNNNRSRRQRRNDRWARLNNRATPVTIRPDHSVVVRHIQKFSTNNLQNGFFDSYEVIGPHNILANSSWNHLLDIYESVRVTRIDMKCYLYGVSMNTPGVTAAMCFRDVVPTAPLRTYEQLAVEPGHKRGRPVNVYTFKWVPIEPSDYEFYDHNQFATMDSGIYGQLNYAGAGLPGTPPSPIIEFTVKYDFKHLVKPQTSVNVRLCLENEDEEWEQPLNVKNPPYNYKNRPNSAR